MLAPGGRAHEVGWEGWVPLNKPEPDQASRAAPLVPGLALRRQPALGLTAASRALSASARTRLCAGTGEAAARMPGGAPMFAPETGRRRTPRHRLARTGSAPRQPRPAFAGRSHRHDVADPCGSAPRADAAPLSNASGSAPSRTGRADTGMKSIVCQGISSRGVAILSAIDSGYWSGTFSARVARHADSGGVFLAPVSLVDEGHAFRSTARNTSRTGGSQRWASCRGQRPYRVRATGPAAQTLNGSKRWRSK